jgi:predicted component of type VI protein secretion system
MQVRLKILQGSNAGKEIKLPAPKCVIGRGDDCHLRPQSDAISRRHCVIITTENEAVVRDLNSRNGTFVNNERVAEESVLLGGDVLRVGPLEFEVAVEQTPGKPKRPKVSDIKEAVARTAESSSIGTTTELDDVSQWLEEADTEEKQRRVTDPETRQFRLDDTAMPAEDENGKKVGSTAETKALKPDPKKADKPEKKKKEEPGKLPQRPTSNSKDSREAAADMLKKFFNRR